MNAAQDTEKRLVELEIKASFAEDQIDQLDRVIVRQQQQIDLLTQELLALRQQVVSSDNPTQRTLRDELPPHY